MPKNLEPEPTTLVDSNPVLVGQGTPISELSNSAVTSDSSVHHHGDIDTQIGAGREFLTMWFNSTYLWASIVELGVPSTFKKTPLGYSVPALVIGATIALGVAYGSAKIQQALDTYNENPPELTSDNLPSYQSKSLEPKPETKIGLLTHKIELFLTDNRKLTKKQVAQLALAMVGQMGDLVGFGIGMLNADTSPLTKPEKMASNLIIMSAGLGASWAAVRPSSNTMKFMNEKAHNVRKGHPDPNQKADWWTTLFLWVKLFQTGIANVSFYGTIADKMNGYEPDTPFGVSMQGLLDTIVPILLVTSGVTFFQYFISTVNQGHYRQHTSNTVNSAESSESTSESNGSLEMTNSIADTGDGQEESTEERSNVSSLERFAIDSLLWLRMAGTGTDCSQPVLLMSSPYISRYIYLATAVVGTGVGMVGSRSDWRTSKESWDTFRKKNQEGIGAFFNYPDKMISRTSACCSSFFKEDCFSTKSGLNAKLIEHPNLSESDLENGRRFSRSGSSDAE